MIKRTERLQGSKNRRDDEYYTLYDDIAAEVRHNLPQLRGKGIVGNCRDDPMRLSRKMTNSVCSQKIVQMRMVSMNVNTAISTPVLTN